MNKPFVRLRSRVRRSSPRSFLLMFLNIDRHFFGSHIFRRNKLLLVSIYNFLIDFSTRLSLFLNRIFELKLYMYLRCSTLFYLLEQRGFCSTLFYLLNDLLSLSLQHLIVKIYLIWSFFLLFFIGLIKIFLKILRHIWVVSCILNLYLFEFII